MSDDERLDQQPQDGEEPEASGEAPGEAPGDDAPGDDAPDDDAADDDVAGDPAAGDPRRSVRPPRLLNALGTWGQVATVVVGVAWLWVFAGGLTVATEPYRVAVSPLGAATIADTTVEAVIARSRAALGLGDAPDSIPPTRFAGAGVPSPFHAAIIVALFFTPTNVALLCVLAGLLGALGARANLRTGRPLLGARGAAPGGPGGNGGDGASGADGPVLTVHIDNVNPYLSGALRGFFVYLMVISGLLVMLGNPFENITPFSYIRFAGLLSLFSFAVSYDPDLFSSLLQRVGDRVKQASMETSDENGAPDAAPAAPPGVGATGRSNGPQGNGGT